MRLVALAGLILLAGCRVMPSQMASNEPFKYYGVTLNFPDGTVDARFDGVEFPAPWARLFPDAPTSGAYYSRYLIDLGRLHTGKQEVDGYHLGYNIFNDDVLRTDLGDGYTMYCWGRIKQSPAFNCSVLLRGLPLAAIAIRDQPVSAIQARNLVNEAEAFLEKAKLNSKDRRQTES